jgi:hypothetical protein
VHNLESGRLVAPHRSGMPRVTCLALARDVLEHDVGRLKDAYRQRVRPILPDRLQQPWQERRAHHLELERLGVGDLDRRLAIVGRLQPREVFLEGALARSDRKHRERKDEGTTTLLGEATGGRVSADTRTRMSGRTSTQPAYAHSCRMISLSLLTASGCATVLVAGNASGRLLNP